MALKGCIFNDTAIHQAKSWDAVAKFTAMHITKCFKYCHNIYAPFLKLQGDNFQSDNSEQMISAVTEQ
jgi:hypothetical protein